MTPTPTAPPTDDELAHAADLLDYLDAGVTPYHVVDETARRLDAAGFEALMPHESWPAVDRTAGGAVGHYVTVEGALVAWTLAQQDAAAGFTIVGAHTDSPGFRVKPVPDVAGPGFAQLGVEVYGGPLLNSWLDRDLGLAGRVVWRTEAGLRASDFRDDRPVIRIPQLAVHLDREVNDKGLRLDRQRHLVPIWGPDAPDGEGFRGYLSDIIGPLPSGAALVSWDVAPFDLQRASLVGLGEDQIASARLDNLVSCHAGLTALLATHAQGAPGHVPVLALFDHEEVGSTTATGADSALLARILERIGLMLGGTREVHLRALSHSHVVSADMAHATHPNYPERHEPGHPVRLNGGPVVKHNAQQRYATGAVTAAAFEAACERAGVPVQHFVSNNTMPCGSTIGPLTASQLGVPTVDVGVAQLGMHSVRELCGAADPHRLARALTALLVQPHA